MTEKCVSLSTLCIYFVCLFCVLVPVVLLSIMYTFAWMTTALSLWTSRPNPRTLRRRTTLKR